MTIPTIGSLKRALELREQIENLEHELSQLLGGAASSSGSKMSAWARSRIGAAQRLRWAKLKGNGSAPAAKKKKRTMSPETRAKIAAVAKKRWKAAKAAGKARL